jgi:trans-aconitate methyltransferase
MVVVLVEVGFVRSVEEAGTGNETGFLWERFWLEGVEGIDSKRSCTECGVKRWLRLQFLGNMFEIQHNSCINFIVGF